jgi:hypothetical protein|tara:strand:+ start:560 stop:916 length:357 start_codon:yes stop_codon:yes gene_type:complete
MINSYMSNNSETLLTANTHPGDSTSVTLTGSDFKGDGYYGRSDGLHTVQYDYVGLTGVIQIQATLATVPVAADWFGVATTTLVNETGTNIQNFTGNYVWLRAQLVYSDGTINSVVMNH